LNHTTDMEHLWRVNQLSCTLFVPLMWPLLKSPRIFEKKDSSECVTCILASLINFFYFLHLQSSLIWVHFFLYFL
jgi:hypothetical protein